MAHIDDYEAPEVRVVGSVADITQGESTGANLDQDFPTGTPFSDLTFS